MSHQKDRGPILILSLEYLPFKGGIATYLGNLARILPAGSVRILAQTEGDTHEYDVQQPMPIFRRRLRRTGFIPSAVNSFFWLTWLARREKPSMVVISHVLPVGLAAWLYFKLTGTPYAVILHGMDIALALEAGGRKRSWAKRVLLDAAVVAANSEFTARLAESAGAPKERLVIAHPSANFAPPELADVHWIRATKEAREHHGLGTGFLILSTARLVKRKGFDTLISAVGLLRQRGREVTLAIAGTGYDRQRLEELAWTEGVTEYVRFLGGIESEELKPLYATCDLFALTPRSIGPDVEGFGIVYLEAGLFAKPVIGTRTGGVSDAVKDGATGLLVPSDDVPAVAEAIAQIMDDPARAVALGSEGRRRAEREFAPERQLAPFIARLLADSSDKADIGGKG